MMVEAELARTELQKRSLKGKIKSLTETNCNYMSIDWNFYYKSQEIKRLKSKKHPYIKYVNYIRRILDQNIRFLQNNLVEYKLFKNNMQNHKKSISVDVQ